MSDSGSLSWENGAMQHRLWHMKWERGNGGSGYFIGGMEICVKWKSPLLQFGVSAAGNFFFGVFFTVSNF